MNTLTNFLTIALTFCTVALFAQPDYSNGNLLFTIKPVAENTWGVFVKPNETISPSQRTSTGSGQVTIVAPVDFYYADLENHGGTWVENARVDAPIEAPGRSYISFGFVTDEPRIKLVTNQETLLFTFAAEPHFTGTFSLIENNNDPFSVPNSYGTNPGNDLGVIDFGTNGGLQYYLYAGNYQDEPVQTPTVLAKQQEKNQRKDVKAVFTSSPNRAEGPK